MVDYSTVQSINPISIPSPTSLAPNPLPSPSDELLPPLRELLREPQYSKLYNSVTRHLEHPRLLSDDQLAELWVLKQNLRTRREYEFALGSLTGDGKRRRMDGEGGLLRALGLRSGLVGGEKERMAERETRIGESVERDLDKEVRDTKEGVVTDPELVPPQSLENSLLPHGSPQPHDIPLAHQTQDPQAPIHSVKPATSDQPEPSQRPQPEFEPELEPEQSQLIGLEALGEVVGNAIHAAALVELKGRNSDDEVDEEMKLLDSYEDISF